MATVLLAPRLMLGWLWVVTGWSRLQASTSHSDPAATGLTLCGVALILGVLTGAVAFGGGMLCAGLCAGTSPWVSALMFAAVVVLVVTWKTAGWFGFDRWILPFIAQSGPVRTLFGERPHVGRTPG